ncbi:hypothetical protein PIB30_038350 [Stylosanthes scabra]|uniref:Uncharacterized protein n=1 Tax=Stylosanthes scabra TaxID=79078 RepID=A0ABU6YED5_9FABA|nr:hypothetical protein [Stylosanthes scabra]
MNKHSVKYALIILLMIGTIINATIADSDDEIIPEWHGNNCMIKRGNCIRRCKIQNSNNLAEWEKCVDLKCHRCDTPNEWPPED